MARRQIHPSHFPAKPCSRDGRRKAGGVHRRSVPVRASRARTAPGVFQSLRADSQAPDLRVRQGRDGERRQASGSTSCCGAGARSRTRQHHRPAHSRIEAVQEHRLFALSDFNLLGAPGSGRSRGNADEVVSSAGVFTDSIATFPTAASLLRRKKALAGMGYVRRHRAQPRRRRALRNRPGQAAFNISAFLAIPGSRWFVVADGQTLFLRVTSRTSDQLEDYIGIGSFFSCSPATGARCCAGPSTRVMGAQCPPVSVWRRSPDHPARDPQAERARRDAEREQVRWASLTSSRPSASGGERGARFPARLTPDSMRLVRGYSISATDAASPACKPVRRRARRCRVAGEMARV